MAKWFTYALTVLGAVAAVATVLQYVETSTRLPGWIAVLTSVPPQILLAIMGLAVLAVLWLGARRLSRLEGAIGSPVERARASVRLELHEQRLKDLNESSLDGLAADLAPDTDRRRLAFERIDNLPAVKRRDLFRRHPQVVGWLAEIEQGTTPEGIPRAERVFTEPDGRVWTFGEVRDLRDDEKEALREAKPRVWRAYRGRLFRDVFVPPEYRNRHGQD